MSSFFWKNQVNPVNPACPVGQQIVLGSKNILVYFFSLLPALFSAEAELRFLGFVPARLAWARDSGQAEAVKKIKSVMLILPAP